MEETALVLYFGSCSIFPPFWKEQPWAKIFPSVVTISMSGNDESHEIPIADSGLTHPVSGWSENVRREVG